MKKEATKWNIFAIFYVYFLMTSIGGYINVQIVYLLRDERYFNMNEEHIGRTTSNILLIAMLCGLLWAPIAGQIYDIFLRKIPMFTAGSIAALWLFLCPHTSPSVFWLTVVRACI